MSEFSGKSRSSSSSSGRTVYGSGQRRAPEQLQHPRSQPMDPIRNFLAQRDGLICALRTWQGVQDYPGENAQGFSDETILSLTRGSFDYQRSRFVVPESPHNGEQFSLRFELRITAFFNAIEVLFPTAVFNTKAPFFLDQDGRPLKSLCPPNP